MMTLYKKIITASLLVLLISPFVVKAEEGNWKKGRIYYRKVCTECHKGLSCGAIAPSTKTKAEWIEYIEADSHAKKKDKLSYYVSKEYRESIKSTNRAAAKFIKVTETALMADIKAFVVHGAKDSDSPARCK